jgi:hypothetical protein
VKFYTTIQKVSLDKAIAEKAWAFAKQVIETTNYTDSNQTQKEKIKLDHFISKLGEEAAKQVLEKYAVVTEPDYTIYQAQQKSWQHDLFVNEVGLAVKTQSRSSANKYGLSWMFQAGDKRKDAVLQNPNAWVVFVECDDTNPYTCYVYPPYQIQTLQLGEPKLAHLIGHKKVVYANTLLL